VLLENKINEYISELMTQIASCPSTLPRLEIMDKKLKEFVRLHHIDLLRTINYQLYKLKINTHITKLSEQLSSFHLTTKQVIRFAEIFYTYIFFLSLFYSCVSRMK